MLPILHVNGYKIANPTIYGTMSDDELTMLFEGFGWHPMIVAGDDLDQALASGLDAAHQEIRELQTQARGGHRPERPRWPMLVLRSTKGWTGIHELDGVRIEGTSKAHQVPAMQAKTNPEHLRALEQWLRSYRPDNCQGWLQGYVLTGRHGIFPFYEAFIPIVDGMVNQYGKFLGFINSMLNRRELFTEHKPVIFNFHGYPSAVHQLIHRRPHQERFHVRGYIEEGTTTTPFDLLAMNGGDRFQLAIEALKRADINVSEMARGMSGAFAARTIPGARAAIESFAQQLQRTRREIREDGDDPPEIKGWSWSSGKPAPA